MHGATARFSRLKRGPVLLGVEALDDPICGLLEPEAMRLEAPGRVSVFHFDIDDALSATPGLLVRLDKGYQLLQGAKDIFNWLPLRPF